MPGEVRRGSREEYVAIRRLADELLPALVARLEASPLGELEVSQDGWRIRLRKPAERAGRAQRERSPADPPSPRATRSGGPVKTTGVAGAERSAGADQLRRFVVSPAVGVFHPGPGAARGSAVRAGDVVGHVEVLGVPQEVLAPFDGFLSGLIAEAGQVVEYGEQLMRIEQVAPPQAPSPEPA